MHTGDSSWAGPALIPDNQDNQYDKHRYSGTGQGIANGTGYLIANAYSVRSSSLPSIESSL